MDSKQIWVKKIKTNILKNEDRLVLVAGFVLVSLISFGIGRLSVEYQKQNTPIIIDDSAVKCNAGGFIGAAEGIGAVSGAENKNTAADGKIIGNKKSLIYHLPGGKFYSTILEENRVYFNSEDEAKKAGYRKSKL